MRRGKWGCPFDHPEQSWPHIDEAIKHLREDHPDFFTNRKTKIYAWGAQAYERIPEGQGPFMVSNLNKGLMDQLADLLQCAGDGKGDMHRWDREDYYVYGRKVLV